jgi:thiamine pyrophosphate-dependent acetolactate synthase large subunit-like protein
LTTILFGSEGQPPGGDAGRPLHRWLADALAGAGVEEVFGVMGEDTAALTVGIIERGITYRGARHEAAAVGMADGYAWASGRVGVAIVTRGPGLMNAATACRTAVQGDRRVVVICGDAPLAGERAFDNKFIEQEPLARALGLGFFTAGDPAEALAALHGALASAGEGRPAVLAVPADLFAQELSPAAAASPVRAASAATDTTAEREPAGAPDATPEGATLDAALALLAASRMPLILAGGGAVRRGTADALVGLAERADALLGTTLKAKDLFHGRPRDVGVVGGFATDPAAVLLGEVDCVLAFGARLTPFTTAQRTLFGNASVVQVDTDPERLGAAFPVTVGIAADAGVVARALLERVAGTRWSSRCTAHALARLGGPAYAGPDESTDDGLDPRVVVQTLDRLLPAQRAVVLDSGRFMTSPGRFLHVPGPDWFRLTAEAGSIAVGLGIALGAALARPRAATVLFIGDGGLSMTVGDLETAARHRIPVTVIVMNDRAYGAERVHLEADGLPVGHASLPEIDFGRVADALGVTAVRVRTLAELEALAPLLEAGRPSPLVVDCVISPHITAARLRWA